MNPLNWHGPAFLAFYVALSAATLTVLWWLRRISEDKREAGVLNLSDPYEIAYLRGGAPEVGRVAIISLIERGAMRVAGTNEVERVPEAGGLTLNPIEMAVMNAFPVAMAARDGVSQAGVAYAADRTDDGLFQGC